LREQSHSKCRDTGGRSDYCCSETIKGKVLLNHRNFAESIDPSVMPSVEGVQATRPGPTTGRIAEYVLSPRGNLLLE